MKIIALKDQAAWRAWLTENHDRENEIWLIYYKKGTGIPCIEYLESLDEALCFGWVDSLIADRRSDPNVGRREKIGTAMMNLMHQLTRPASHLPCESPDGMVG